MSDPASPQSTTANDLESVIATGDIVCRGTRSPDRVLETRAHLALVSELARAPETFFEKLVEAALPLVAAGSTGISLLAEEKGRFVWPAVAGGLASFIGQGTPMDFGPCGTVLERNCPLLFKHPERHFTYLEPITPPLHEVLLVPFHVDGHAVGTIWAVAHDETRRFDAEDLRVLEGLSTFAASAYAILVRSGSLKPWLSAA